MSNVDNLSSQEPLLSVIIPVYNVEDYLREALNSVRNQSYRNVEFIAIDDGSTDSSGEILDEYAEKDNRFRVYHQENAGLSATRNRGLQESNGEIIYFFDSDDILAEGTFEKVIRRIVNTNSQLVLFGLTLIIGDGKILKRSRKKKGFEIETPITGREYIHQTIPEGRYGAVVQKYFIQRSFLTENNLVFEEGYIHEDESFTLEVLCLADRLTCFSEKMIKKRLRKNSIMSTAKGVKNIEGWTRAIVRLLSFMKETKVNPKTRETVLIRLRQVAHTAIRTLNNLDLPNQSIDRFLSKENIKELGFLVRVHATSPFLYRALKFINRKLGS